jgi:diguanylate cyclase (GGDEF)-like protein
MALPEPIRVLLAEDVRTDAELALRELKRAGLRVEPLIVDTVDGFRRALAEFRPEIILSDFNMPRFDGMHALALARELAPDVPFIFVSGTIGEEYAIRAMKSGATDYVLKNNLVRLPPSVERALAEAREHRAKRQAERRLERLSRVRELASAVNAAMIRIRDRQELFREFCRIAVEQGRFVAARLVEFEPGGGPLRIAATTDGRTDSIVKVVEEFNRDPESSKSLLASALRGGEPVFSNDAANDPRVRQRDWFVREGVNSVACMPLAVEGRVAGAVILRAAERGFFDEEEMRLLRDLTGNLAFALEMIDKQERLDYLALYDPLTGLPNRRLLFDRLAQAIEAARQEGRHLALMVLDIERFKAVNDALGTAAADRLLQLVAKRVKATVSDLNRIARTGGDQFAVAFPSLKDAAAAGRLIEKIGARFLDAAYEIEGRELRLVAKAGVSIFPEDGGDPDTLFRNAEAALKKAKRTGDRYLFYAPGINASVAERLDLEGRLRRAVEREEFLLHFQPIADLASRRVTGFEALLRWRSPEGADLVSPAKFVPVLEDTGLVLPVGSWVMRAAVAQHRRWREAGLDPPRIAVNVSAIQIRQPDFVARVREALEGIAPRDCPLALEITESLLMDDIDGNIRKLREVREMGLRVALDDFGTGYSSLAYLGRLPIETLKIDRGFVRGMTENADDTSIVTMIISLAQALRLGVVAEGVETEEQARLLRLLRCDQMQGYLFSPPVPAEKIEPLLVRAAA